MMPVVLRTVRGLLLRLNYCFSALCLIGWQSGVFFLFIFISASGFMFFMSLIVLYL
jgi:hypothetical protein